MMSMKWMPLLAAVATMAAPGSAAAESSEWNYTGSLYGWFPGIVTTVETPVGEVESEIDFEEVLEDLDFAFLGAFEARKGRVSLITDLQYYDIGVEAEPPTGTFFSSADVDSKIVMVSGYATYALIDSDDLRFDVGAGLRYIDVTVETNFVGEGSTPDASFETDGGWTDALIAARLKRQFNERWHGVAYADIGGFGIGDSSDLTWQAFAGAGYRFNETWSAVGGYRHLDLENTVDNVEVEAEMSGPFLGFQASF